MYGAAVVRKKEGRMKLSLPPNQAPSPFFLNANVLFLQVVFESHTLCMTKLRVLVLCFHYFTYITPIVGRVCESLFYTSQFQNSTTQ
jgi:hypothetical protein